ncbi:hypothetical protein O0I10_005314 [Lichtheimia ornata]|uniref:Late embryogenesis abundant protein LEA-2 subgroup domain-containing protein n=1 Tax=Lichtheimia ornata TaxID=688661 RepID=A0AAD7V4L9_9FUNG|nr:uncharacterized protein O0I10_005314 [Lichtheimia ornata]KAJ8658932.1 hypothetical protein O0I10_005314 [Lichtheimia ornata]
MTFQHQSYPAQPPPPPPPPHADYDIEKHSQFHRASWQPEAIPQKKRPLTERNCCCRCLCCACCLPVWARYIVWFIIIGIIICIIVIGALLGTFKMPEVNVLDVTNPPGTNQLQIDYNGTEFDIGIGLIVNVVSPNNLPIHLSDMHATATLPTKDGNAFLGSGYLAKHTIPTHSNSNFTFPFTIQYDTTSSSSQLMLNTLLQECGLYGGSDPTDITVDYTIHLAASVLFVTIHPSISGSASFACPLSNDGFTSALGGAFGG